MVVKTVFFDFDGESKPEVKVDIVLSWYYRYTLLKDRDGETELVSERENYKVRPKNGTFETQ